MSPSDQLHFKCSVTTCGFRLLCGAAEFLRWPFPTCIFSPDLMSQWWTLTPTQCLHLEVWKASQTPNIHSWASVLPRTCPTHRLPASTNVSSGLPRLRSKSSKWPLTLLPSQFWSPIWSISKSRLFYLQNTSGIWPLPTPCIAATWSKPPILLTWVTEIASSLVFSSPLLPWTLQTMVHPDHRVVQ